MGLSTSLRIPRLRDKLFLLYAYSDIRTDRELAIRLGISAATLSGYIGGTATSLPERVPQSARDALARILVGVVGNISEADARALWLEEDFDRFARAFQAIGDVGLGELLATGTRGAMLHYLPGGEEDVRGIYWPDANADPADPSVRFAELGDTFALSVTATPGDWLLLVAAGPDGCGVAPAPDQVGPDGKELVPADLDDLPQFLGLPGPHRFVAIATRGPAPLALAARRPGVPVTDRDWLALARELRNPKRVEAWRYDTVLVQVRPAR